MTNPVDPKGGENSTPLVDDRPEVDEAPLPESTLAAGPPPGSYPADLFTDKARAQAPDAGVTEALSPIARLAVGPSSSPDPEISRVLSLLLSPEGFEQLDPTDPSVFFIRYADGGLKKIVFLEPSDGLGLVVITLHRSGNLVLGFIPHDKTAIIQKIRETQRGETNRLLPQTLNTPFETTPQGLMMPLDLQEGVAGKAPMAFGPVVSLMTPNGFDVGNGRFLRLAVDGDRIRSWLVNEDQSTREQPFLSLSPGQSRTSRTRHKAGLRAFTTTWFQSLGLDHPSFFQARVPPAGRVEGRLFFSSVEPRLFGLIRPEGSRLLLDLGDRSNPTRQRQYADIRTALTSSPKVTLKQNRPNRNFSFHPIPLADALTAAGARSVTSEGNEMIAKVVGGHIEVVLKLPDGSAQREYFYVSDNPFGVVTERDAEEPESERAFLEESFAKMDAETNLPYSTRLMVLYLEAVWGKDDDTHRSFVLREGVKEAHYRVEGFGEGLTLFRRVKRHVTIAFVAAEEKERIALLLSKQSTNSQRHEALKGLSFNAIVKDRPADRHSVIRDPRFGLFIPFFAKVGDQCRFQFYMNFDGPAKRQLVSADPAAQEAGPAGLAAVYERMSARDDRTMRVKHPGVQGLNYPNSQHVTFYAAQPNEMPKVVLYLETKPRSRLFFLAIFHPDGMVDVVPFHKELDRPVYLNIREILGTMGGKTIPLDDLNRLLSASRAKAVIKQMEVVEQDKRFTIKVTSRDETTTSYQLVTPERSPQDEELTPLTERQQLEGLFADASWHYRGRPYETQFMVHFFDEQERLPFEGFRSFTTVEDGEEIQYLVSRMTDATACVGRRVKRTNEFTIALVPPGKAETARKLLDTSTSVSELEALVHDPELTYCRITKDKADDAHSILRTPVAGVAVIYFREIDGRPVPHLEFNAEDPRTGAFFESAKAPAPHPFTLEWFNALPKNHPNVIETKGPKGDARKYVLLKYEQPTGLLQLGLLFNRGDKVFFKTLNIGTSTALVASIASARMAGTLETDECITRYFEEAGAFPLERLHEGLAIQPMPGMPPFFLRIEGDRITVSMIVEEKKHEAPAYYHFSDDPLISPQAKADPEPSQPPVTRKLVPFDLDWFQSLPKEAPHLFFAGSHKFFYLEYSDGNRLGLVTVNPTGKLVFVPLDGKYTEHDLLIAFIRGTQMPIKKRILLDNSSPRWDHYPDGRDRMSFVHGKTTVELPAFEIDTSETRAAEILDAMRKRGGTMDLIMNDIRHYWALGKGGEKEEFVLTGLGPKKDEHVFLRLRDALQAVGKLPDREVHKPYTRQWFDTYVKNPAHQGVIEMGGQPFLLLKFRPQISLENGVNFVTRAGDGSLVFGILHPTDESARGFLERLEKWRQGEKLPAIRVTDDGKMLGLFGSSGGITLRTGGFRVRSILFPLDENGGTFGNSSSGMSGTVSIRGLDLVFSTGGKEDVFSLVERERPTNVVVADERTGPISDPTPEELAEQARARGREFIESAVARLMSIRPPQVILPITGINNRDRRFETADTHVLNPIPIQFQVRLSPSPQPLSHRGRGEEREITKAADLFRKGIPPETSLMVRMGPKGSWIKYEIAREGERLILSEKTWGRIFLTRTHMTIEGGSALHMWFDREVWGPGLTIDHRPETSHQGQEIRIAATNDPAHALFKAIRDIWKDRVGAQFIAPDESGQWSITVPCKEGNEVTIAGLIDRTREVYAASMEVKRNPSIVVGREKPEAGGLRPENAEQGSLTRDVGREIGDAGSAVHGDSGDQQNNRGTQELDPRPQDLRIAGMTPTAQVEEPPPLEEETFNVTSRLIGEDGVPFDDIFYLQLEGVKDTNTGHRFLISGSLLLHHEIARILDVDPSDRGHFKADSPIELKSGLKISFRYPGLDEEPTFHLQFDDAGILRALREPFLSDWEIREEGGKTTLVGHVLGERRVVLSVKPFPEIHRSHQPVSERRFLVDRESLPQAVFWPTFIGQPYPYASGEHSDIEVVLSQQGKSLSARFIPFKRNRDDTIPVRVRYLSGPERKVLEAALGPSVKVDGAAADKPVEVRAPEFPQPSLGVDLINPGEVFLPTPETLAWLRDTFLSRGLGRIPFADGTRLSQRLEFASDRGLVISVPVRWRNRPRNPFEIDIDHRERFIEHFIRGQRETTLKRAGTDLRVHDQRGFWQLYIMTPVGEGKVKPFNLSLVISPHSPVLAALVNTLDENKTTDQAPLYRERAHKELARHVTHFFGRKSDDLPTLYIPSPVVTFHGGRRIDLIFRGVGGMGMEVELAGLKFSRADGRIDFAHDITLTFMRAGGDGEPQEEVIHFEQTEGENPGTIVLTEITDGAGKPRVLEWNMALCTLAPKKSPAGETAPEEMLRLLDEAGLPVIREDVIKEGEGLKEPDEAEESEKTLFREGTTLSVPAEIAPLPARLSALQMPEESAIIPLSDPDLVSDLFDETDLHDLIFRPDEVTLFAQALVGRTAEMMTFVADGGIILQIPMIAEERPLFRYLADEEADPVYQVKGARLLVPDPNNREVYYEIPSTVLKQKTLGGYDQNILELQIPGLQARNFNLEVVSTRETYGAKQVFGLVAKEIGRPSEVTDAHVRAWLKALVAALGLDGAPTLYGSNLNLTTGEIIRLSDGRLLDLAVKKLAEGKFAIEGFKFHEGEGGFFSSIDFVGDSGTDASGRFFAYRAPNGVALFHLEDQTKGEHLNLIVSAEGDVWIWPRTDLRKLRELLDPPYSANFPMTGIGGEIYATDARSSATRRTLPESSESEPIYEITAALGRWDEAISSGSGESARVRFEVVVKKDGTLGVGPGKMTEDEKGGGATFPFGEDFRVEIVEDRWGEGESVRRGKVRVIFYQQQGKIREGKRSERETPYGWLEFANRESLIGHRKNFRVSRAHFHPIRFRETNLMPHDRGFLTKRAGVWVDESLIVDRVGAQGLAPLQDPFKSTEARADDLPVLLGVMEYLGLVDTDGNYDDSLLVSLAFFAALQNPVVAREDLLKKERVRRVEPVQPLPIPVVGAEREQEISPAEGPPVKIERVATTPVAVGPAALEPPTSVKPEGPSGESLRSEIAATLAEVKGILDAAKKTQIGYSLVQADYIAIRDYEGEATPMLKKRVVGLLETAKKMRDGTLYQAKSDPLERLSKEARSNPEIVKAVRFVSGLLEKATRKKKLGFDDFINEMKGAGYKMLEKVWWPYVRELILRNRDRVSDDLGLATSIHRIVSTRSKTLPIEKLRPGKIVVDDDDADSDVDKSEARAEADREAKRRGGRGGKGGAGAPPSAVGGGSGGRAAVRSKGTGKKHKTDDGDHGFTVIRMQNDARGHDLLGHDGFNILFLSAFKIVRELNLDSTIRILARLRSVTAGKLGVMARVLDKKALWQALEQNGHGYIKQMLDQGSLRLSHEQILALRAAVIVAKGGQRDELERLIGGILSMNQSAHAGLMVTAHPGSVGGAFLSTGMAVRSTVPLLR